MVRVVTSSSRASASIVAPCRDDSSAWSTFHWRMTSWLRGTAHRSSGSRIRDSGSGTRDPGSGTRDPDSGGSLALFETADFTPSAAIRRAGGLCGRAVHAFEATRLDLLGRGLWRHVVVEDARLGLLHMLVDEDADNDVLDAAVAAAEAYAVAFADGAVRPGVLAIDFHLAAFAGALGFR